MVSWKDLTSPEIRSVWTKLPYAKDNRVNLSMFKNPFALQGTELRSGDDLIMLWKPEEDDYNKYGDIHGRCDLDQPNAIYVVLSRALDHSHIKVVNLL